jgi:hypothetical protein
MSKEQQRAVKKKWLYTSKQIYTKIDKHTKDYWVSKAVDFVFDRAKINKLPYLTTFWKENGCWIFDLRDDLSINAFKKDKHKQWLDKFYTVKKILADGTKQNVIDRNIDKSTFALAYLTEEADWLGQQKTTDGAGITIQLTNWSLEPPTALNQLPTNDNSKVLADADVIDVETVSSDYIDEDDIAIPIKEVETTDIDIFDTLDNFLGEE